ncbi:MAG: AsmA-like C-terminal region-containing protein, partial [Vicinamibacteria bacterium]
AKFRGRLGSDGLDRDALEGAGELKISHGMMPELDFLKGLPEGVIDAARMFGADRPADEAEKGLGFDLIRTQFRIERAVVENNPFKIKTPYYNFRGRGKIGFNRAVSLKGDLRLGKKMSKRLAMDLAFLMDEKGRISIPLKIVGTLDDPIVKVRESYLRARYREFGSGLTGKATRDKVRERYGVDIEDFLRRNKPWVREWIEKRGSEFLDTEDEPGGTE